MGYGRGNCGTGMHLMRFFRGAQHVHYTDEQLMSLARVASLERTRVHATESRSRSDQSASAKPSPDASLIEQERNAKSIVARLTGLDVSNISSDECFNIKDFGLFSSVQMDKENFVDWEYWTVCLMGMYEDKTGRRNVSSIEINIDVLENPSPNSYKYGIVLDALPEDVADVQEGFLECDIPYCVRLKECFYDPFWLCGIPSEFKQERLVIILKAMAQTFTSAMLKKGGKILLPYTKDDLMSSYYPLKYFNLDRKRPA